jgi:hypothetical protein
MFIILYLSMSMEKKQLSDKLNQLLGVEDKPIAFEKLPKEDLERLLEIFTNVAHVAQVGVRSLRSKVEEGGLLLKPAREIANMRVIDLLANIRREGGLLGMLDSVLQERKKTAKQ